MQYTKLWLDLIGVIVLSFVVLGYYGGEIYRQAPPVLERVVTTDGVVLFTGQEILVYTDSARLSERTSYAMMNTLVTWHLPFRRPEMRYNAMNEFFLPLLSHWEHAGLPERSASPGYVPQIASHVDGSTFCIKVDLPGVEPAEIDLTVQENQLTLSGERKVAPGQHNGNLFRQEMRYGPFSRTFTLPDGVRAEELQARFANGVLEITVLLPAARLPKKVPVQIAQTTHENPPTITA